MIKPGIPQGTRDFSAAIVRRRQYIFNTIRNVFELYGYEPLETPAMELLDTLTGKYGEEGDKLIFKILNNGLHDPANIDKAKEGFVKVLEGKNSTDITSRALRYDLTIPFARYVAMNRGVLSFPYKRYQIQPVWRADRPQKGRYREFTQCDADVVGSNSLWNEVELVEIYRRSLKALGLSGGNIHINNRKILTALAELCGAENAMTNITIAIDKLDKIGLDKVLVELNARGLNPTQVETVASYLKIAGKNEEKIKALKQLFVNSEIGQKGIEEIEFVLGHTGSEMVEVDVTLARGLDYYTGMIFEVKAPAEVKIGSIGGGGRYDNLTGLFGVDGISGVGISFGIDRIYDVIDAMQLFPDHLNISVTALLVNLGEQEATKAVEIQKNLQENNISCQLYPDAVKLDKQFKYAEKKGIPYVIVIGSRELEQGAAVVKNLNTGQQITVPFNNIFSHLQNN